jgi:hypothetical protein
MQRIAQLWLMLLLFTILLPVSVATADELTIEVNSVRVFAEPSTESDEIATLEKGETIQVSKKGPVDGFYKVLIKDDGRKRVGYVRLADLRGKGKKGAQVLKGGKRRRVSRSYFTRYGIGLIVGLDYTSQGSRRIESTDNPPGSPVDVSSLSGLSPQYGFFLDFPISNSMAARGYLILKQTNVTGSATLQSTNPKPVDVFVTTSFVSIGGTWKYYGSPSSSLWGGAGLQIDKGLSGTIKYGNQTTAVENSYLPTFFFPYVAGGIDWMINRDWGLLPELRLGSVVNAKPAIYELDFNLGVAYAF